MNSLEFETNGGLDFLPIEWRLAADGLARLEQACGATTASDCAIVVGRRLLHRMPPPKAVCPDLVIGFMSMPYVMRYNHFPY